MLAASIADKYRMSQGAAIKVLLHIRKNPEIALFHASSGLLAT